MSDPQQIPGGPSYKRLVRTDGPVSGVCGGLAQYVGIDPTLVRVLVAIGLVFTFPLGVIAYVVLWAVMPRH